MHEQGGIPRRAKNRFPRTAPLWAGGLAALCLLGCSPPPRWSMRPEPPALPPVTDRLRATYPELATNRFLVLADFEKPEQGEMFYMDTPSQTGYFHLSTARSRPETGAGALECAGGSQKCMGKSAAFIISPAVIKTSATIEGDSAVTTSPSIARSRVPVPPYSTATPVR